MKHQGEGFGPYSPKRVRIYKLLSIVIVTLWGVSLLIAYRELLPAWAQLTVQQLVEMV